MVLSLELACLVGQPKIVYSLTQLVMVLGKNVFVLLPFSIYLPQQQSNSIDIVLMGSWEQNRASLAEF